MSRRGSNVRANEAYYTPPWCLAQGMDVLHRLALEVPR